MTIIAELFSFHRRHTTTAHSRIHQFQYDAFHIVFDFYLRIFSKRWILSKLNLFYLILFFFLACRIYIYVLVFVHLFLLLLFASGCWKSRNDYITLNASDSIIIRTSCTLYCTYTHTHASTQTYRRQTIWRYCECPLSYIHQNYDETETRWFYSWTVSHAMRFFFLLLNVPATIRNLFIYIILFLFFRRKR